MQSLPGNPQMGQNNHELNYKVRVSFLQLPFLDKLTIVTAYQYVY